MKLEFIKEQIDWVNNWTSRMISDMDEQDCGLIDQLDTSINWQTGHIIISNYFHCLESVQVSENEIIRSVNDSLNIDEYKKYYFAGSDPKAQWPERPNQEDLLRLFSSTNTAIHRALDSIKENQLSEETVIKNPVGKTKYDALSFAFKHQMWHNGQIAMMKRILRS